MANSIYAYSWWMRRLILTTSCEFYRQSSHKHSGGIRRIVALVEHDHILENDDIDIDISQSYHSARKITYAVFRIKIALRPTEGK